MKKHFTLIFIVSLAATLSSCCSDNVTTQTHDELKVMAWNIWHGGHSEKHPVVGCEGTIGILKQSDADVILMIETYGASDKIADSLGFYHRLLSSNLSIYSRYPIVKTYTFTDSDSKFNTFHFGGVEIDMDGRRVRLFDTWLDYRRDGRMPKGKSEAEILAWDDTGNDRNVQIRGILSAIKPLLAETDSIPLIMGGDFNTPSHLDWTEATKDMYGHDGNVVNWNVTTKMEEAGFKDSFRELNPDPTQNLGSSIGISRGRSSRIDYIFYQGATIQAIETQTYYENLGKPLSVNGKNFFYASDHGLVLTTFQFTNKTDK